MPDPSAVFFSYAREDSAFAIRLAKDLRDAGHPVWLDQLDIPAGARWDTAVESALAESKTMLVLLSPAAVGSPNVMDEVSFAVEEGRRVIPILLAPCKIPFRLRRIQYVDFTGDYDSALKKALRDFPQRLSTPITAITDEEIIESTSAPESAPAPTPVPTPVLSSKVVPSALAPPAVAARATPLAPPGPPPSRAWLRAAIGVMVLAGVAWVVVTRPWAGVSSDLEDPFAEPIPSPAPAPASAPVAAMSADVGLGKAPLEVRFRNGSTGEITDIEWDFGDGTKSTEREPMHTFAAGSYNVILTVRGPGGFHVDTSDAPIVVEAPTAPPTPPRARFTSSAEAGVAPVEIQFYNATAGQVSAYQWSFGDGGTSTATEPRHRFATPGPYEVLLTATGPGGSSQYRRRITVVAPRPLAVRIVLGSPRSGPAPLTVRMQGGATFPVREMVWTFGDGTRLVGSEASKTFDRAGKYTVTLQAIGEQGSANSTIEIEVTAPVPTPELDPRTMADRGWKLRVRSREGECVEGYRLGVGPAVVMACGGYSGQTWKLLPLDAKYFQLTTDWVAPDGLCLNGAAPNDAATFQGAAGMIACSRYVGQLWIATRLPGDYYRLQSEYGRLAGLCLDGNVSTPEARLNGALYLAPCNGGASQQWKFTPP